MCLYLLKALSISSCKKLERLHLDANPLYSLDLEPLQNCPNLRELVLPAPQLTLFEETLTQLSASIRTFDNFLSSTDLPYTDNSALLDFQDSLSMQKKQLALLMDKVAFFCSLPLSDKDLLNKMKLGLEKGSKLQLKQAQVDREITLFLERFEIFQTILKTYSRVKISKVADYLKFDDQDTLALEKWIVGLENPSLSIEDDTLVISKNDHQIDPSVPDSSISKTIDELLKKFKEFEKTRKGKKK